MSARRPGRKRPGRGAHPRWTSGAAARIMLAHTFPEEGNISRMPVGTASGFSSCGWLSALILSVSRIAPMRAERVVMQWTVSGE